MALKLKGSTSGFVALDSPAVAGNNTITLPDSNGSANAVWANDNTAGVTTYTQVTINRNGDIVTPGTLSIGGTITYEDVTNVDSVGLVTAAQGVRINGGGLSIIGVTTGLSATGVSTIGIATISAIGLDLTGTANITGVTTFTGNSTFGGDVTVPDKIIHSGDTDTAIRFPAADTITAETGGSERLRITSAGLVGVNCTPVGMFEVQKNGVPAIISNYNNSKHIQMGSGDSGAGFHLTDGNFFTINNQPYADRGTDNNLTERLRIDSSGRLLLGTTTEGAADADDFTIATATNSAGLTIRTSTSGTGRLWFSDGTSGAAEYQGYVQYDHNNSKLELGSVGATKLTINSSGNAEFSGIVTATNFAPSTVPTSHRNRMINGDMSVLQRYGYTETTIDTNSWHWIADRFKFFSSTDGTITGTGVTSGYAASNTGSGNALRIKVTSADTSLSGTQQIQLAQIIEGHNWDDMRFGTSNAKSFTVSFSILATGASAGNVTGTYCVNAVNDGDYNRSYVKEYTIDAVDTWKRVSLTFPGCTDGTWQTGNNGCIRIGWFFAGPTSQQGAADQWHSSYKGSTSNQKNGMGVVNNFYFITDVQVEEGTVASAYERRSYAEELARCQRYYQQLGSTDGNLGGDYAMLPGYTYHNGLRIAATYPSNVKMRTTPTIAEIGNGIAAYGQGTNAQVATIFGINTADDTNVIIFTVDGASSKDWGDIDHAMVVTNNTGGGMSFSAEI